MTDERRMDAQRHGRPANAFPERKYHDPSDILLIGLIPPMTRGYMYALKQMLRKRYQGVSSSAIEFLREHFLAPLGKGRVFEVSPRTAFTSHRRYTKAIEACYVVIGLF